MVENNPQSLTEAERKTLLKRKNWTVLAILVIVIILLFSLSFVRFGQTMAS
jgi:hypothetical protein